MVTSDEESGPRDMMQREKGGKKAIGKEEEKVWFRNASSFLRSLLTRRGRIPPREAKDEDQRSVHWDSRPNQKRCPGGDESSEEIRLAVERDAFLFASISVLPVGEEIYLHQSLSFFLPFSLCLSLVLSK
jgi:hypothetical protein